MNTEVKSAARMLDLLEYLAGCAEPVKLKDIVATLGFPKSSAHALAQTLVSRGYAIQDTAERYVLVHASRHRSATRAHEARLLSAAHPVMERLRDASGETVVLAVRNTRGEAKRLAKCVSRQAIRFDVDLDGQSDSYCTATGRLLLAHWDEALANAYLSRVPLLARTPKTPTNPDVIRALFVRIRDEDVSICDEEHVLGSTGLATPIRGRDGSVVAALNLGVVTMRYHQRSDEVIAMLKEAGRQISARLGYRPG
ncbi:IclR family transcriptional regulator [Bosea sp. 124]|uniref:IclR family transcriptional regulator n=1 Tax=Bosea sp. 124 TaxID=2135642 RepID=UPI000D342F58|nr:IclR family transcriptional regulator [Bosea sp. 124]PTM41671.1 IclR family transcriptional regulator [Bosea sp. 124]